MGGVAVIIGLIFARKQLNSWKTETRQKRQSDVAGDLLTSVLQVSRTLEALRTPFDSAPPEGQESDKLFALEVRYKRFSEHHDLFKDLQTKQIQAMAYIDDSELNADIEVLFSVRTKVVAAIKMLAEKSSWYDPNNPDNNRLLFDLEDRMLGTYGADDKLGKIQLKAVERIQTKLIPIVRLENKK
ncbi:MAG: hypothetical protein INF50_02610 [Rhodobacter sp.]|nr:hypothetical protein [Rhodobacter sp.]